MIFPLHSATIWRSLKKSKGVLTSAVVFKRVTFKIVALSTAITFTASTSLISAATTQISGETEVCRHHLRIKSVENTGHFRDYLRLQTAPPVPFASEDRKARPPRSELRADKRQLLTEELESAHASGALPKGQSIYVFFRDGSDLKDHYFYWVTQRILYVIDPNGVLRAFEKSNISSVKILSGKTDSFRHVALGKKAPINPRKDKLKRGAYQFSLSILLPLALIAFGWIGHFLVPAITLGALTSLSYVALLRIKNPLKSWEAARRLDPAKEPFVELHRWREPGNEDLVQVKDSTGIIYPPSHDTTAAVLISDLREKLAKPNSPVFQVYYAQGLEKIVAEYQKQLKLPRDERKLFGSHWVSPKNIQFTIIAANGKASSPIVAMLALVNFNPR